MKKYFTLLTLGSNLGDRLYFMRRALDALHGQLGVITAVSGVYESAPWGFESDKPFYNAALRLETPFLPAVLLAGIAAIERRLGRQPRQPRSYSDRTIDIDIIYFEDWRRVTGQLQLPHPRRAERRFALLPLVEIAARLIDPEWQLSTAQLLANTSDPSAVKRLDGLSLTDSISDLSRLPIPPRGAES